MFKKTVFLGCVFCILPNAVLAGNTVSCDANYYLPANSTKKEECTQCPNSKTGLGQLYCPGGKNFRKNFPFSQGIDYCNGKITSASTCDTSYTKTLDAGNYFPVKSDTPTKCSGTNLTEAKQKITKELDDMKAKLKAALSVSSNASSLGYYVGLVAISQADVGKLYCPGGSVGYDWKYPLGIKVCNKKYVTGENNQTCTDTQPNNTVSSSESDAIHCDSGYYLPKGATDGNGWKTNSQGKRVCTAKCNGKYYREDGYVCQGGWYKVSQTEDMGLTKCKDTQIVSINLQNCIDCVSGTRKNYAECTPLKEEDDVILTKANRSFSCDSGFYLMSKDEYIGRLIDNSTKSSLGNETTNLESITPCMSCFDYGTNTSYGYRCPGIGPVSLGEKEQGKYYCQNGQVTTRDNPSQCVDRPSTTTSSSTTTETKTLVCPAGQVWVNGQCVLCTSKAVWISYANENRMYCPGVTDTSLPILQQLKNCPKGAWPNSDLTDCDCRWGTKAKNGDSCQGTLYHDDLYYGPDGKNTKLFKQCWTKVSEKAYKKCMGFDN